MSLFGYVKYFRKTFSSSVHTGSDYCLFFLPYIRWWQRTRMISGCRIHSPRLGAAISVCNCCLPKIYGQRPAEDEFHAPMRPQLNSLKVPHTGPCLSGSVSSARWTGIHSVLILCRAQVLQIWPQVLFVLTWVELP